MFRLFQGCFLLEEMINREEEDAAAEAVNGQYSGGQTLLCNSRVLVSFSPVQFCVHKWYLLVKLIGDTKLYLNTV